MPVREAVEYARAAEEAGIDSLWVHETYGLRDAHTYLATMALVTDRLYLGAGCMNSYTRNAALMAMSMATLQELAGGRIRLGLGTAYNRLRHLGHPTNFAPTSLGEMTRVCRQLWAGETVTYEGRVVTLRDMKLSIPSCTVPIYLAGGGPKLLAMAPQIADGVLDGPMVPAATIKRRAEAIAAAQPRASFEYAAYIFSSVADDPVEAREAARHDPFLLYMFQVGDSVYHAAGLDASVRPRIAEAFARRDLETAASFVTDQMLSAVAVCGTPDEIVEQLAVCVEAGLQEPILQPLQQTARAFQSAIALGQRYIRAQR